MKNAGLFLSMLILSVCLGCNTTGSRVMEDASSTEAAKEKVAILQSWQGDYPVAQLDRLPEEQKGQGVGAILDAQTYATVWKSFKPDAVLPIIDFDANMVLFARNTQFFNRISIGQVNVTDGVAEVLAMETMSAMPIEDKVAMSMAVVAREGITGLKTSGGVFPISE